MLRTKLHRPPITKEHVFRDHLIDFLHSNQYKPFTLVSATAGYGKSMLISSWLEKCKCHRAWISLSEDENDFRSFLDCIDNSIKGIFPHALEEFGKFLNVAELPPTSVVSETLINELDNINEDHILVLDDYHLLHNNQINELVDQLLRFPPQHMHLVIITRRDPALNLSSLRAHSRMNEIRIPELCFDKKEIDVLFKRLLNTNLSNEMIDSLYDKTEGWITGLRLASLTIEDPKDSYLTLKNLDGDLHYITDFLIKEVLLKQPGNMQQNLLRTSILNRFSAELIDHLYLTGNSEDETKTSGRDFIDWLIKSNMFIIPLDDKRKWFRFHHLFQDLVQNQLIQEYNHKEIQCLHINASNWFEQEDFIEEAIYHALESDNVQIAVEIILKYRNEMMSTEKWTRLNIWMSMLPDIIVQSNPQLLIITAFYKDYTGKVEEAFALLDQIESLISELDMNSIEYQNLYGEYCALLAEKQFIQGQAEKSLTTAKKALELLPDNAEYPFSFAVYWGVFSLQQQGKGLGGENFVLEIINSLELKNSRLEARLNIALCGYYYMQGDLVKLEVAAKNALKLGKQFKLQESIDLSHYFLGSIHYFRNELDKAEIHFNFLFENRYNNRLTYAMIGKCILILIHFETGQIKKVSEDLCTLTDFTYNISSPLIKEYLRAVKVEVAILRRQTTKALELDMGKEYGVYPPLWFVFVPQLTSVNMLMASDSPANNHLILEKLEQHLTYARTNNNRTFEMRVLIMMAVHLSNTGNGAEAANVLSEALRLAEPGRFIRIFLDGKDSIENLIKGLSEYQKKTSFINQVLLAFELEKNANQTLSSEATKQDRIYSGDISKSDSLSFREMDVLKQLAKGLRNKEIAELLHIAPDTVKSHLKNINSKLNVTSRIHAVRKATELGIIEVY